MSLFKIRAALLAGCMLLCACAPAAASGSEADAPTSSQIASEAPVSAPSSTELGIPSDIGTDGIYTAEMRQRMQTHGFTYADVEALIDLGYTPDDMFLLTAEQKDVYAAAGMLTPYDGSLFELTTQLYSYIEGLDDYFTSAKDPSAIVPELNRYGESVLGRPLYYWRIRRPDSPPKKKVMLTFAIHGWEGETSCDGAYLAEQACQIAFFYCRLPQYLRDTELILVPMVNPDGVMNRNGGHKFGRGQSQGIDMNRDFLAGEFHAPETVALSALMKAESPDIFIDFHGWFDECYGDPELGRAFSAHLGLAHVSEDYGTRQGYLYGYAKSLGMRSLLVEHSGFASVNTKDLILSLNLVMSLQLS